MPLFERSFPKESDFDLSILSYLDYNWRVVHFYWNFIAVKKHRILDFRMLGYGMRFCFQFMISIPCMCTTFGVDYRIGYLILHFNTDGAFQGLSFLQKKNSRNSPQQAKSHRELSNEAVSESYTIYIGKLLLQYINTLEPPPPPIFKV